MDRRGSTEGTQRRTEPCPSTKGRPGADRLSALSDELLLHILSFLQIRAAISTSSISRRWRYLYHCLPSLDFSSGACGVTPAWFIDRVLLLHAAPKIEVFRLSMRVCAVDSAEYRQIDSRLLFAVRRGVRVLDLVIHLAGRYDDEAVYGLPPWIFHCRTLEDLSVRNCHLRLPGHISLVSLKKMRLSLIKFHNDELKRLLVGCPLLQSLELKYCDDTRDLVIDAGESRKLEELVIVDRRYRYPGLPGGAMHICAPSVKYLTYTGSACRGQYEVRDLSSLVAASFDLKGSIFFNEDDYAGLFTMDLLLRIHQVQVLKLCSWSLQAFFITITELRLNLDSALPGVTRLELTTWLEDLQLQAILSALHSCSKLRTLVLSIRHRSVNNDSDGTYGTGLFLDSNIVMQDLKTIIIQGLPRYNQDPAEEGSETGSETEDSVANDIGLIGFLLRVSPALERLVVQPEEDINTMEGKWELLFKLSSDLLSLPRASPKAQVIVEGI